MTSLSLVLISSSIGKAQTITPKTCYYCLDKEETQKMNECFLENEALKQGHINEGSSPWTAFFEGLLLGGLVVSLIHR